jgi:hypothetical protein
MEEYMRFRLPRLLIVALLLVMIVGCSRTRLAYNFLDWVIAWNVDDYIQFNHNQEKWFEQRLDVFLTWHRYNQLPKYAQFLEQLQKDIDTPITIDLLERHLQTIEDFWQDIVIQVEPDITKLLLWLNQNQKQELFENLAQKHRELEEKILELSVERGKKKRIKRTEKIFKRFIGKLTADQKAEVETWTESLIPTGQLWMENSQIWQHQFQQVLNGDESDSHKRKQLRRLLLEPESLWLPEYRDAMEHNRSLTLSFLVSVHNQLNGKQRKRLQKRLWKLQDDFNHLSKDK